MPKNLFIHCMLACLYANEFTQVSAYQPGSIAGTSSRFKEKVNSTTGGQEKQQAKHFLCLAQRERKEKKQLSPINTTAAYWLPGDSEKKYAVLRKSILPGSSPLKGGENRVYQVSFHLQSLLFLTRLI